jgi:hypothetical protein
MASLSKMAKRFGTDEDREEAGVWCDFGEGMRVKIRRMSSRKVQDVQRELNKPHTAQLRIGPLPDAVAEDMMYRVIATGIIADWEGIDNDAGEVLPYTAANALTVVKKFKEFRDNILQISANADAYRVKVEEAGEANL